jgi:hypothetical protein
MKRRTIAELLEMGYYLEAYEPYASKLGVFTKDFVVGDRIRWLGHDHVHGLLHGQEITANCEAVEKRLDLPFFRLVCDTEMGSVTEPERNLSSDLQLQARVEFEEEILKPERKWWREVGNLFKQ